MILKKYKIIMITSKWYILVKNLSKTYISILEVGFPLLQVQVSCLFPNFQVNFYIIEGKVVKLFKGIGFGIVFATTNSL